MARKRWIRIPQTIATNQRTNAPCSRLRHKLPQARVERGGNAHRVSQQLGRKNHLVRVPQELRAVEVQQTRVELV